MNRTTALALAGVALLSLAAGCSSDKKISLPGNVSLPGGATLPDGLPSSDALGSCHVKVTGDVTAEWTSNGGSGSVGYGPWIPKSVGSVPIATDETFFILNCQGDGANYVGFMPVTDGSVPMQPGTYTIAPADNAVGTSQSGAMVTLLGLEGTDTNWGPSAQGTLNITAFDSNHIAGNFTIPVTDVLAKLTGTSKGDAMITGEFDYANPNG